MIDTLSTDLHLQAVSNIAGPHAPLSPAGAVPVSRTAMRISPVQNRTGLTLLEVMVALVILGLVATGFLETFAGAFRATARARTWSQALVYAQEGQEAVRVGGAGEAPNRALSLGGGFSRQVAMRPWRLGLDRVTVTVILPDGARFELDRLVAGP